MSQKQACAIFATSFLAGLLVTAVVFQPFSVAPTTTPYFGFPGESEALNSQSNSIASDPTTASQPPPPESTEALGFSNLPKELAESISTTLREHLQPLGEKPATTISFPQAVMLSTEEMLSLENLAKRAGNGSVSVTAFNGTPASEKTEQATDSLKPFSRRNEPAKESSDQLVRSAADEVSSEQEAQPVANKKTSNSEANTANIGTSITAEKQSLASDDGSTHLETPQLSANRLLRCLRRHKGM